jgi:hypothetical protein
LRRSMGYGATIGKVCATIDEVWYNDRKSVCDDRWGMVQRSEKCLRRSMGYGTTIEEERATIEEERTTIDRGWYNDRRRACDDRLGMV